MLELDVACVAVGGGSKGDFNLGGVRADMDGAARGCSGFQQVADVFDDPFVMMDEEAGNAKQAAFGFAGFDAFEREKADVVFAGLVGVAPAGVLAGLVRLNAMAEFTIV